MSNKFKGKSAIIYILILFIGLMAFPMHFDFQRSGKADAESDEPVIFTNVTYEAGFKDVGGNFLAWGDYNDDGYQDLLVNGNRLFRNNGPPGWNFTEVTNQVGIGYGTYGTWADWNNDGFLDFYAIGHPTNPDLPDKLYKNTGPPLYTFQDVFDQSGITWEVRGTGVGWGDYDNDGFVDFYKLRGEDYDAGLYFPDRLYHNNGDGTFTDVTEEAGVSEESDPKYGRGVAWADYDFDGDMDIYISNYRQQFNYLYQNNGDGTFTDVGPEKGVADGPPRTPGNLDPYDRGGHGVGSIWGDYDNDGDFDLWVTNLNHKDARTSDDSLLYRNNGAPSFTFTNMRYESEIPIKPYVIPGQGDELFVGCAWGDMDNDGDLDLYIPQIYSDISYAYSFLYRNNGDGTFTDVTVDTGVRVWDTYAGCWCDYDNDGDLDLVTSGKDGWREDTDDPQLPDFVHLFRNEGNSNNWIHLNLKGDGAYSNSAAIGARVNVTTEQGHSQIQQVEGGMGPHGHQNSLKLEFGLESSSDPVNVTILWPSGTTQFLENLEVNRTYNISEPSANLKITNMIFDNPNPIRGENVRINAVVKNIGLTVINSAEVRFYLDHIEEEYQISTTHVLNDLNPGAEVTVYVDLDTASISGPHTIYIEAEIIDPPPSDPSNTVSKNIYVRLYNEEPVAVLQAEPPEIERGESVHFDGSSSTDDISVVEYYFEFGDGSNSGWIQQNSIYHTYEKAGDFTANLTVRDEDGGESEDPSEIDIEVWAKPVAVLTADRTSIFEGESITFNASQSYDEGGIIEEFYFDFDNDEYSDWITSPTVTHVYSEPGEYNASLMVKDDDGNVSENEAEITIEVLSMPFAVLSADPTSIYEGESITFNGSKSIDLKATIEAYNFVFDDGESSGWITQAQVEHRYNSTGTFTASLTVRNDLGDISTNEAEVTITVDEVPNEKPTAIIDSIEPNPAPFGTEIAFSGYGEDVDGDIVAYSWRSSLDGELSNKASFQTSSLSQGNHTIFFKVRDDFGTWSEEDSRELKITASIPVLTITSPENNEKVHGKIMIRGTTSHMGGEVTLVEIKIDDEEWIPVEGTENWQYELDTTDLSEGSHTIHVKAFDGVSYSDVESVTIIVERDAGMLDNLTMVIIIAGIITVLILLVLGLALRKPPKSKPENLPTFTIEGEQFTM